MADPTDTGVRILNAAGEPMAPSRASLLVGGSRTAYDAADVWGEHGAMWQPYINSPDNEINSYRDRIVARVRDLARNDGWASGTITRIIDNAVGAVFRPIAKPDWRALQQHTGLKTYDATWAREYGKAIDAGYRVWADDEGCWCDAARKMTMPQIYRLAFRHKMVDGDALAQMMWLPERQGPGRARYATCVQSIDPDRLSNPYTVFDMRKVRGGVEIDDYGAAVAYHIRQAHPSDWFNAAQSVTWQRIPRETAWGRPIVVHDYDVDRAAQHRGGVGILGPVVMRLKALVKYDSAELDSAILNAVFAAYIESPNDPEMVEQAMGAQEVTAYQAARSDYHDQKRITLNGARMPIVFPGEKIATVDAARPNSNFAAFEKAVLRNVASAAGVSAQQVSNDWSDVNYSSARGAMLEAYKTLDRRRIDFGMGFARRPRSAWMEESHAIDNLPLPRGAAPFIECRAAYSRAKWMGPGLGWIDPVAEREGAVLGMEAALSTLEHEVAMASGEDYEDVLDQRKEEMDAFKQRGLEPPASWLANRPAAVARAPGEGKDDAA